MLLTATNINKIQNESHYLTFYEQNDSKNWYLFSDEV